MIFLIRGGKITVKLSPDLLHKIIIKLASDIEPFSGIHSFETV